MDEVFTITVHQQGNRLGNYRKQEDDQRFQPSLFNIVLMTKEGEFVKARYGSSFGLTLHNMDEVLNPGEYVVMIGP